MNSLAQQALAHAAHHDQPGAQRREQQHDAEVAQGRFTATAPRMHREQAHQAKHEHGHYQERRDVQHHFLEPGGSP